MINRTLLRFLFCGGLASFINWAARIAFSQVTDFTLAVIAAYVVGMVAGFVLYRGIVWPASGKDWHQQVMPFIGVNLMGAGVVLITALALVQAGSMIVGRNDVVEALAHAGAIAIGAGFNYYGHNRFTFGAAGN